MQLMQRVTVCLFVFGSQSAMAQGITNPAGGGQIPVALHILLGLGLLGYVFASLAFRKKTAEVSVFSISTLVIFVYLIIGFTEISISDHQRMNLYLYLEMLLIIVGTIFLLLRGLVFQVLAIGGVVAFVGLLNFVRPQLIDLQTRIYVDNEKDINFIEVSYPSHWREMHLEDGRVLLNINPHKRVGGSMRMIADANRIKSPVSLGGKMAGESQVIFDVYKPQVTHGTWGWKDRPKAFFNIPLLGTVHIPRFENHLAGRALLLDENKKVKCEYLYEARGKPIPNTEEASYVRWSIEFTVEQSSVIECER